MQRRNGNAFGLTMPAVVALPRCATTAAPEQTHVERNGSVKVMPLSVTHFDSYRC